MAVCSCGVGGVYDVRTTFASSGKIAFTENTNARGKRSLNLRNFCILFFFSIARLVSTFFFLLLINCAHRYSRRCHGSLVSVSRSYSPVSVRKKKRYSIFDIEVCSYCIGLSGCLHVEKSAYSKENDATFLSFSPFHFI